MSADMPPLLPTSQNGPSGLGRVEAFWNSFRCDHSIAELQSVPAFLLSQASMDPRSSVEVARQHASARMDIDGQRKRIKARKDSGYISLSQVRQKASAL